ncbi:hypothetical protein CN689_14280 [Peribacillus butanolivorans]|uniref:MFS transporter n=1 Tax=Peribacillus butanolivorans TaxID=421767 RepID=A0AAX0RRJ7_9BACI|nr:hypothetical protein CN689_14280 [Peribacillus butanolivorans]
MVKNQLTIYLTKMIFILDMGISQLKVEFGMEPLQINLMLIQVITYSDLLEGATLSYVMQSLGTL